MIAAVRPDRIIHCAALVPQSSVDYSNNQNANESLSMLANLLLASDCPVVFISSMTVYGATLDRPVREEDGGQPQSAYGVSKWQAEVLLRTHHYSSLAIRIPGLFSSSRRSGLIYNVLYAYKHRMALPKLPDAPVLWSAMHVNDAAAGVAKLALGTIAGHQAINFGYRGKLGINHFLTIASQIFSQACINMSEQPEFEFDLSRAEAMGVVPNKTFYQALQQFADEL
jgi:nucleoside-diphosphate-sugar epimerase